jgi:GPI inositol-deacylase
VPSAQASFSLCSFVLSLSLYLPHLRGFGLTDKWSIQGRNRRRDALDARHTACVAIMPPRLALLLTTAVACLSLLAIIHFSLKLEPQGCLMSMMAPVYLKLSGFDTEHSRFASKYSLYLYREEGVDPYTHDNIGLGGGVPVLFIPGNAGSYKQVRSLSSEASRYYHNYLRHDQAAKERGVSNLDFFTLDFNEDLAAFHGQTVIDQAEYVNEAVAYILSLYSDPGKSRRDSRLPDPSSVILIGHSMGGIVARTVLIMPNYQANSVNTIITMSTPHARPPVSFDADIVQLYQQVNDYWRDSYTQRWASSNPLWHTTLISIAGGARDTTVPADYCSLSSLVPSSHGFTVFTSGIPDVWTPMDHLAITWADQLRKVIVKSLFDVVDVRRGAQTKPRAERIRAFRKWFLTGLEEDVLKTLLAREPDVLLTLGDGSRSAFLDTDRLVMRGLGAQDEPSAKLLAVPSNANSSRQRLSILTDQPTDQNGNFEFLDLLFCSTFPLHGFQSSAALPVQIDLSDGSPQASRLACKRAAPDVIRLPASLRTSKNAFDQHTPFTYLQYDIRDLREHQFVAIVDRSTEISSGWLIADTYDIADSITEVKYGTEHLLTLGAKVTLPATRPLMTEIKIPAMESSLLAYDMQIKSPGCGDEAELFTPLLRQHLDGPYESKYFVNFKQGEISLHGNAPFMPPALNGAKTSTGAAFQIWSDPSCNSTLEIKLKANFSDSLGKLVIRYRTVFAAFPLLVVAMVLRKQFRVYDSTGVFISFSDGLEQSIRLALPVLFLSMTFFATAFSTAGSVTHESSLAANNGTGINYASNDLLLGSQDSFFWFLVPLAGLISIGVCAILNYLVLAIIYVLCFASTLFAKSPKPDDSKKASLTPIYNPSSPRRRIINTSILLLLVATVIPYPFAFLVACIVQLATCTRALRHNPDFFNYAYSILLLMLWCLPINLPTLVVWVHNLAVHWGTPFSSHHNVLSIMPFILLVETLASGNMVPRQVIIPQTKKKGATTLPVAVGRFSKYLGLAHADALCFFFRWATNILFFGLAVYAAFYGMTYAYRLHYIANVIALWLFILHMDGKGSDAEKPSNTKH